MDVSLIEKHFREHRQKLVKRMMFRSGTMEDAEDIVQESYLRALKYYKSYDGKHFDQWFSKIINNCLREQKNIQKGHAAEEFIEEEAEGTNCPHYSNHIMKEVFELIDTKGPIHQEILNMHLRYEYTAMDISKLTLHSYANCHKVISRFRDELRELYG